MVVGHGLWRLLTSVQAPFLKEKKGVRISALYLQKKRNLLVSYVNILNQENLKKIFHFYKKISKRKYKNIKSENTKIQKYNYNSNK